MLLAWTPGYDGNLKITEFILQIQEQELNENDQLSFRSKKSLASWENAKSYSVLNTGQYRITGLHPGTRYMCRVKAKNRLGFSDYSLVKVFSTQEKGMLTGRLLLCCMLILKREMSKSF